ncbi:Retrovirus-related Pol polyprotein from type-1 retrotransposable element R1 2, partial [Aphis craccivora]
SLNFPHFSSHWAIRLSFSIRFYLHYDESPLSSGCPWAPAKLKTAHSTPTVQQSSYLSFDFFSKCFINIVNFNFIRLFNLSKTAAARPTARNSLGSRQCVQDGIHCGNNGCDHHRPGAPSARGRTELRRLLKNETKEARQTVDENILSWWQQKWEDEKEKEAWTKRLIPKIWDWLPLNPDVNGTECISTISCGDAIDDVEHTFFKCSWWARKLADLEVTVKQAVTPEVQKQ